MGIFITHIQQRQAVSWFCLPAFAALSTRLRRAAKFFTIKSTMDPLAVVLPAK
ncbi:MAG: hypothetical protein HGA86_03370 [Anaerolineaceae bacterium]|nr:hypothetical protein [Anaerolineaceae bacterium]